MVSNLIYSAELMIPIGGIFGILFWIMIFLGTYRHFPKMNQRQKIIMSAGSATLLTLLLLGISYLFMVLIVNQLMG